MKIFLSLITAAVVLGAPGTGRSPEAIPNEDALRVFAPDDYGKYIKKEDLKIYNFIE